MVVSSWKRWWNARFRPSSRVKASAEWLRRQNALRARKLRGELLETRLLMATELTNVSNLTLSSDPGSPLLVEIGGRVPGDVPGGNDSDGYDQINVSSAVTLTGTLQVQLVNGFVPSVGDEFIFMTTTGSFTDKFDQAQGLLFPSGDRFFDIVVSGNEAKLVVKQAPGAGLQFTPTGSATADRLGEFLGTYFGGTTFTYSGAVEVADFFSVDGSLTVERKYQALTLADGTTTSTPVEVLTIGGSNLNAFAGANAGTSEAVGLSLTGLDFGVAVAREKSGDNRVWTAMKANATGASFAGSSAINLSASNLAVAVNRPAGDGSLIDFNPTTLTVKTGASSTITLNMDSASGSLLDVSGTATVGVAGFATMSGDVLVTRSDNGSTQRLTLGVTNGSAFVGIGSGTDAAKGVQLSNVNVGLIAERAPSDSEARYAVQASGAASLQGVAGLTLAGTAAFNVFTSIAAVPESVKPATPCNDAAPEACTA